MQTLIDTWLAANLDPSLGVLIMPPTQALALSMMLNPLGQPLYPEINLMGGTLFGLPVITSMSAKVVGSPAAGSIIALLNAPEILLADDGEVTISTSSEASIQMLDNPTNHSTGDTAPTTVVCDVPDEQPRHQGRPVHQLGQETCDGSAVHFERCVRLWHVVVPCAGAPSAFGLVRPIL